MKPFFLLLIMASACTSPSITGQQVVNHAIAKSGVAKLKQANASFSFRNFDYTYQYKDGRYTYTRSQTDTLNNTTIDVLTNDGFVRSINGAVVELTEKEKSTYRRSVNSVVYFAFLPLWLNDAAVNKELIGTFTIHETLYYKVRVTFDKQGGGEDHDDVFYYWFDANDYSMDYLAYEYNTGRGGIRFREAYNTRNINGVTIQDYKNLKPIITNLKRTIALEDIDKAYLNDQLVELSVIELKNVVINTDTLSAAIQ